MILGILEYDGEAVVTHRALMVLKMSPEDAERVAALFAEHDSKDEPAR
jgi:hypothetical protein